ncbi:unnamed protein product [Diamesa hyperborea]
MQSLDESLDESSDGKLSMGFFGLELLLDFESSAQSLTRNLYFVLMRDWKIGKKRGVNMIVNDNDCPQFFGSENDKQNSDVTCGKASDYIKDCFKNATDSSIDMWQTNSAPYTIEDINSRCL